MKLIQGLWTGVVAIQFAVLPVALQAGATTEDPKDVKTLSQGKLDSFSKEVDKDIADYETKKGPALPLHTIDGVGGILITPVAYLSNPGPKDEIAGLPSFSATYINAREKNVQSFAVSETLIQRVEISFAASRFGTGTLRDHVRDATTVDIGRDDVWLYNANVRGVIIPENSFDLPFPQITGGISFKQNDGIDQIDKSLGGALTNIGYKRDYGFDYTLTATKAFPKVFDRTLLLTAGVRFSEANQLGYVGFSDTYHATFEANFAYSLTPWLWLAGEYRQKTSDYGRIPGLVETENDWWTVGLGFLPSRHTSVTIGYGYLGNVLDTREKAAWAAQFKYEL